jgi:hypothetical protein
MKSQTAFGLGCTMIAALLASAPAPAAHAQQLGIYGSAGQSSLAELRAADGVGAYLRVAPRAGLSARVGYHRHDHSYMRVGRVCDQYLAGTRCVDEQISTRTLLQGVGIAAALRHSIRAPLELEFGGGPSINVVRPDEHTTSGRATDTFSYRTAQPGLLVSAAARVQPARRLPLIVELGATNHFLLLSACAAEGWRHSPYCGTRSLRDVRLGIAWDFRR